MVKRCPLSQIVDLIQYNSLSSLFKEHYLQKYINERQKHHLGSSKKDKIEKVKIIAKK
jgi:hypothetical protein